MNEYLIRVEAVNIFGNSIYDTKDLSTIRGGGLSLLDAPKQLREWADENGLPKLETISDGASIAIFRLQATFGLAAEVRNRVEQFFNKHECLRHSTFTVDVVPLHDDFPAQLEVVTALNRFRQMRSPTVVFPHELARSGRTACELDGIRPAVAQGRKKDDGGHEQISRSVATRREYGRTQKQEFYSRAIVRDLPLFVNDFEELATDASRGNLNGKMAVIHVDGNGFGAARRERCKTPDDLRTFDMDLQGRRLKVLRSLVEWAKRDDAWKNGDKIRLETLLWGGDEIIWVVPAWLGWRTLSFFFESWVSPRWPLTHSAGMVFCHYKAPIHRITALAQSLTSKAKECAREALKADPTDGDYFAYQVLESFDHTGSDLNNYRSRLCPDGGSDAQLRRLVLRGRTMRSAMEGLPAVERILPRRKLHAVVRRMLAAPAFSTGEERAAFEKVTDELRETLVESVSSVPSWAKLIEALGGPDDPLLWVHLEELWDYIV